MLAIGLTEYGGPEVLKLIELPEPHAKTTEVRIKVKAAGVNPVDVMVRDGSLADWFGDTKTPYIPGMDVTGIIDELGPEVDPELDLSVGQEVVGVVDNFGSYGAYSQYICLPAQSVISLPLNTTYLSAASFLMNALTARQALDTLKLKAGSTLLVTGSAGAVGAYVVALAKSEGLDVLATGSIKDHDFLKGIGAKHIIPRDKPIIDEIKKIYPNGVDGVVDTACLGEVLMPAVRSAGVIISLRPTSFEDQARNIKSIFVNVRDRLTDHAAISRLGDQVAGGVLPLRVAATFPAIEARQAHQRLAQGGIRGRIILDFERLVIANE